jgi:undecaprenyl-diphosphatase
MTWYQALVLGIVEGLTEYLPISSTGHLILTSWLLGLAADAQRWRAAFSFNVVIQSGAIAAVLLIYHARVRSIFAGFAGLDPGGQRLGRNLLIAFLPSAVAGVLVGDAVKARLNGPWPVVIATFAGACLMLAVVRGRRGAARDAGNSLEAIDGRAAFLIGLAQCVAMWPGTSRSMATIVSALVLGLRPTAAAEFSFLLGLVTLTAATTYTMLRDGTEILARFGAGPIMIGLCASTMSAAVAVRWFVRFLNDRGLAPFAWYRILLAVTLAGAILSGQLEVPDLGTERSLLPRD